MGEAVGAVASRKTSCTTIWCVASAPWRPEIEVGGRVTAVLAEQTAAVDVSRLGDLVGHLSFDEPARVDAALRVVLDL